MTHLPASREDRRFAVVRRPDDIRDKRAWGREMRRTLALLACLTLTQPALAGPGDLERVILAGDDATLALLLDDGADPDEQADLGTALHAAAVKDDVVAARLLLEHGAKVDGRRDGYATTPLHTAASYGNAAVAA
ncbi:MAG: ankyrin repeat domain-containing protein, partial [Reyranellaceae bacterium]